MELLLSMERIVRTAKIMCTDGEFGVTYHELLFLFTIKRGKVTINSICDFLLVDKASVSRTLSKLVKKKMLKKNRSCRPAEYYLAQKAIDMLQEVYSLNDFITNVDLHETSKQELDFLKEVIGRHENILVKLYALKKME